MTMSSSPLRSHVGVGPLNFPREASVFINCPFDDAYRPLYDAIVFATLCCGFLPRCAVETGNAAAPRMDRILTAMRGSKYSIHDLSRCRGEGDNNLARFNMPLELGIAMAQRFGSTSPKNDHDWLVLVPEGHNYKRFLSDLAGYDPVEYNGSHTSIVPGVMSWLATRRDAVQVPTPKAVLEALPRFAAARTELCAAWCDRVPWPDLLTAAIGIARQARLIPSI
jgi:hypothetical protein